MKKPKLKDLVQVIKDNPGCTAIIDNDSWTLIKTNDRPADYEQWDYNKQEDWEQVNILARDGEIQDVECDGGYGSGCCYGGDILQALAKIVGIRVESV